MLKTPPTVPYSFRLVSSRIKHATLAPEMPLWSGSRDYLCPWRRWPRL